MSSLFASGRIIDAILAFTVLEGALVIWYRRRTGRGPPPAEFLCTLVSGLCLLSAVRVALSGAWWGVLALCLLASLIAHLAYLRVRWT